MTVLMGYADKVSVAPGETIGFKVSCAGAVRYRADIVRVLSPEAGPEAPPFRSERVESPVNGDYPAREQKRAPDLADTVELKVGYTINLNLPETTNPDVFNAIFKSLKEHLLRG